GGSRAARARYPDSAAARARSRREWRRAAAAPAAGAHGSRSRASAPAARAARCARGSSRGASGRRRSGSTAWGWARRRSPGSAPGAGCRPRLRGRGPRDGRWRALPFAAFDAAKDMGVSLLRPRRDEAEPARRALDVLLDRRRLGDELPERVAEPVPAGEADRAMGTPRPHLEELDLHV